MKSSLSFGLLVCLLTAVLSGCATVPHHESGLGFANVFTDNMVLQRSRPIQVWGTAAPGRTVTLELARNRVSVKADRSGAWSASLPALEAGGPYILHGESGGTQRELTNVLVGDVWICSGQSNMAFPVYNGLFGTNNGEEEVAKADYHEIRLLTIKRGGAAEPQAEARTDGWVTCSPETVGSFSAVGYFFGREVYRQTGVPLGLINTSYGGTMAETWMSRAGLDSVPTLASLMADLDAHPEKLASFQAAYDQMFTDWLADLNSRDAGWQGQWFQPGMNDGDWAALAVPGVWEEGGYPDFDGLMWFRKSVDIPAAWADKDLRIRTGNVNDRLTLWFNGTLLEPWAHNSQTDDGYVIPAGLVRTGTNVVTARVFDAGGVGGFYGPADGFWLRPEGDDGTNAVSLAGDWRIKVGLVKPDDLPSVPFPPPFHPGNPNTPSGLYNAMIAPLTPMAVRGVIWYQGESNAGRAAEYREVFPALINDWRTQWHDVDLPFLFVQLANYMERKTEPGDAAWAELREAQSLALSLPHTAQAVIIDIGEADDIHPRNKQDVGRRLGLAARALVYDDNIESSGPVLDDYAIKGNAIVLAFSHARGGLDVRGGHGLPAFELAGEDRVFHWADATVNGSTVTLTCPEVPNPVAARYGWAANPDCTLYNFAGLPASPFRTDDWPGETDGKTLELKAP